MPRRLLTIVTLMAFSAVPAWPQRGSESEKAVETSIKVYFDRVTGVELQGFRVQVLRSGMPVTDQLTSSTGEVHLLLGPGSYRVRVTGQLIEDAEQTLSVMRGENFHTELVLARLKEAVSATHSDDSMISAAELHVPEKARNEFEKGLAAYRKADIATAQKRMESALAIYPKYAGALNQLGVISMNLGMNAEGESYFKQALAVNDKFPPAYANLAKVRLAQRDLPEAEALLGKGLSADPLNPQLLSMQANLHLAAGRFAEAIAAVQKVHAQPHEGFSVVHLIAAQAYEKQNQPRAAVSEYRLFLAETPQSPSSEKVRAAMAADQARSQ